MHRPNLPVRTLSHVATALGVLCIAVMLTSNPFDRVLESFNSNRAVTVPMATIEPVDLESPLSSRVSILDDGSISSRGGQRDAQPLSRIGENIIPPAPSATATRLPTQTPKAIAKATATPTPTGVPTQAPEASALVARVGIQVGHWKNSELPAELASLRGSTGAAGQGWREVDVNLDVAQRVAALLRAQNVIVELIPATVPVRYKADAFVAVHGDANSNTRLSGYKMARASWSRIPARDDELLNAISSEYAAATGLQNHPATITRAMTDYYAFNQRLQHAVDPSTPSVILELGFLTTTSDRKLLMEQPDRAAEGLANGILKFLGRR